VSRAGQEEATSGSARLASRGERSIATRSAVLGSVLAMVVALAGVSFGLGVRLAPRFQSGPDNSLPTRIGNNVGASDSLDRVVSQLRGEGVLVRRNVRESLDALLHWFDRRPDLQAAFTAQDGSVDLVGLLGYAATVDDATAVSLVPYRPGLSELRGRMGIIEGGGADVTSALFWLFANRTDPQIDTDPVITILASVWKTRPEIHQQFLVGGRLQVAPFVFWAANVPSDDPSVGEFRRIQFQLDQLPAELPAVQ
jgi:hypothetical protein